MQALDMEWDKGMGSLKFPWNEMGSFHGMI